MKFNKIQEKQIAAAVQRAKDDRTVTFGYLIQAEIHAPDFESMLIAGEVYRRCREWSDKCSAEYGKLSADCQAIEAELRDKGDYDTVLFDSLCHEQNVLVEGRDPDSVDFWNAMINAAGSQAGGAADEIDLDLNTRLGYPVY